MREDLLVPYAFTGPALAFGAGYGLMKGSHGLDLTLDFGMAPAWTRAGDPGLHARYALGAAYHALIYARARRSSWLGVVTRFSHELASLVSWDDAHGYWLDALMVGPALRHTEQPWPGAALELQTDVGLLGLSSRPPARRLNKQDALTKVRYHFNRLAQQPAADPLHYMLAKPLYAAPGERFYYRDVDPQVLGYLLQQETGETEENWTRRSILAPLGIQDYLWERGPDGVSMAAHGLHLRARDMAKLGQLMLEDGSFAGQRVVSTEWTALSTQTHVEAGDAGTGRPRLGYGYYWWTVNRQDVYSAWGHGGQHILISPSDGLVAVKIALPDTDDLEGSSLEDFLDLIEPLLG
jgi:hypothetical protein